MLLKDGTWLSNQAVDVSFPGIIKITFLIKEYKVGVFHRDNGHWNFVKDFPCSIGATATPTITGQYVYHQYQTNWQYEGYYVGPIMGFYRGYALHSTLINNNGTDRDARVGKKYHTVVSA